MCVGCEGLEGSDAIRAAFARVRGMRAEPSSSFKVGVGFFGETRGICLSGNGPPKRKIYTTYATVIGRAPFEWWSSEHTLCYASASPIPPSDPETPEEPPAKRRPPPGDIGGSYSPSIAQTVEPGKSLDILSTCSPSAANEMSLHDYWEWL